MLKAVCRNIVQKVQPLHRRPKCPMSLRNMAQNCDIITSMQVLSLKLREKHS